jgi:hypothetical protein
VSVGGSVEDAATSGTAAKAGETSDGQKAVTAPPAAAMDARACRRESSNNGDADDDADDIDEAEEDSRLRLETSRKGSNSAAMALNKLGRRFITMVRFEQRQMTLQKFLEDTSLEKNQKILHWK